MPVEGRLAQPARQARPHRGAPRAHAAPSCRSAMRGSTESCRAGACRSAAGTRRRARGWRSRPPPPRPASSPRSPRPWPSSGAVVWVMRRDDLFAPGLASLGFPAERLIQVRVRSDAQALAALEDALAAVGVAAAVGEVEDVDLTAGRRLQLACETHGATGFVLRRRPFGGERRRARPRARRRPRAGRSPRRPASPRRESRAWGRRGGGRTWNGRAGGGRGPG